jgi:hypothetical protein
MIAWAMMVFFLVLEKVDSGTVRSASATAMLHSPDDKILRHPRTHAVLSSLTVERQMLDVDPRAADQGNRDARPAAQSACGGLNV